MNPAVARLFTLATLVLAAGAAVVILRYLGRRPLLDARTKLSLLVGIGILPLSASLVGSYAGIERSRARNFCASCHTMADKARDAADPTSTTLASIHSRNHFTGEESCYTCHQDYAAFGEVTTKLNGLRHLYEYYAHYQGEAGKARARSIRLYKPYPNTNCMQCHSTQAPRWTANEAHQAVLEDVRSNATSCVSCHAPVHPGKDGA